MNLGSVVNGKSLSLSSGAWLLARYPRAAWGSEDEYLMVSSTIETAVAHIVSLPSVPEITIPRRDSREPDRALKDITRPIKVYTDYDEGRVPIERCRLFELTESPDDADFLLVVKHITNFFKIPKHQFLSQFPYEGGFVRKDLLPLTVRRCCYIENEPPSWWLPYFDMSTEFHLFSQECCRRQAEGLGNMWIVKPSQGTRAIGHQIFYTNGETSEDVPSNVANSFDPFDNEKSSDKIAQLLVSNPLLARRRKIDLRVFVVVRSFVPVESYMCNVFYARMANKEYSLGSLCDNEVALTVNAYSSDEAVAARQERLTCDELRNVLFKEKWGFSANDDEYMNSSRYAEALKWWEEIVESVRTLLSELFRGVSATVGTWPMSRAYYAVDVIFDDSANNATATTSDVRATDDRYRTIQLPVAKLLEVNFMGDWHGMEGALVRDDARRDSTMPHLTPEQFGNYSYEQWCEDLLVALISSQPIDNTIYSQL